MLPLTIRPPTHTTPIRPTQQIDSDMRALARGGISRTVTYTLLGTYADIPAIAKAIGFQYVIAAIYHPDNPTEITAASSPNVLPYTDAFVVGNEGLQDGRYTSQPVDDRHRGGPAGHRQASDAPRSRAGHTTPARRRARPCSSLGDWLFPNIDYFLFPGRPSTPHSMWTNVSFVYSYMLQNNKTPGPVVAKEAFYPTGGADPIANPQNQIDWYGTYAVPGNVNGTAVLLRVGRSVRPALEASASTPTSPTWDCMRSTIPMARPTPSRSSASLPPISWELMAQPGPRPGCGRRGPAPGRDKSCSRRTRSLPREVFDQRGSSASSTARSTWVRRRWSTEWPGSELAVPPGMKRFEAVFQGTGTYLDSRDEIARRFAK